MILWGQDSHALGKLDEVEDKEVGKLHKRLTLVGSMRGRDDKVNTFTC